MKANVRTLINGKAADTLSSRDRGFQYGDGLFETLALFDGEVKFWPLHWLRLCDGCARLFLPKPNEMQILSEIDLLSSGVGKEIVKVIVSRGEGVRGYAFNEAELEPTRVVSIHSWPDFLEKNTTNGVELFVCQTAVSKQPALAGIKHLNRLENVLARHEWNDARYAEGIMLDGENNVVEGTMSNLFLVKDSILQTPALSDYGVAGITRQRIMAMASEKGITLEVNQVTLAELEQADEVFICNTVIGIWPVKKIRLQYFQIGGANSLTQLFQKAIV